MWYPGQPCRPRSVPSIAGFSRPVRSPPLAARGLVECAAILLLAGCGGRGEPPGAKPAGSVVIEVGSASGPSVGSPPRSSASSAAPGPSLGTIDDNLPFSPSGVRVASTALRTWIYTDVGPKRTRYGYLRAGTVVDVRAPEIKNEGCDGGWYRVNPRGFVCVGMGATLDVDQSVAKAADTRPIRGQAFPYVYALADDNPPLLYFKLPSAKQMAESEGGDVAGRAAAWRERSRLSGLLAELGNIGAPPDFLAAGQKLDKPYGAKQPLRYLYHAGALPRTAASRCFGSSTGRIAPSVSPPSSISSRSTARAWFARAHSTA